MSEHDRRRGQGPTDDQPVGHDPTVGQTEQQLAEDAATTVQAESEVVAAGGTGLAAGGLWSDAWRELRSSPLFIVALLLIVLVVALAVFPQWFATHDPADCPLTRSLERPSAEHWFGTDLQGCDYYTRTIYGTRNSVSVGLLVVIGLSAIALVFGTLAGYYGRWVDTIIARVTDVVFALPLVLGGLVLLTVLPGVELFGYTFSRNVWTVAAVIALFAWPPALRLMRGSALSTAQADYILAARALGASDLRIMRRHLLPNAITPLIVYCTIAVGLIIVAEAVLTFLGVGLQRPTISWGLMISQARGRFGDYPHLLLAPGAFLSVTVLSFIMMGDALRDAFDPKLR